MTDAAAQAVPEAVSLTLRALTLRWGDADTAISAATLRAGCRCAVCRAAHLRGEHVLPDDGITLVAAEPVGLYALRLRFSDGHDRGIYPWVQLRELA